MDEEIYLVEGFFNALYNYNEIHKVITQEMLVSNQLNEISEVTVNS